MSQKKTLITGATGRIGNVLLRKLCEEGRQLKVLVRKETDLNKYCECEVEQVIGDITNQQDLLKAMHDVDVVYHLASLIEIGTGNDELVEKVNVRGTENVIEACRKYDIRRLVYVSSIHALKEPPIGEIMDESLPFNPKSERGIYDRTKAIASMKVMDATREGLNAVIVCPTGVIGPYDHIPSLFGKSLIDFIKKPTDTFVKGAYDYVDVRDVVYGMIQAEKLAQSGELFLLSGEKMSMTQFYTYVSEFTGVKAPTKVVPYQLALILAKLLQIFRQDSDFTPYSLQTLTSNSDISHEKATRVLGYHPRSVKESIGDQIRWFEKEGMV